MIVIKFGGSSVSDSDRIMGVARIIRSQAHRKPVVVVSGLGGITDELISLAKCAEQGKDVAVKATRILDRNYRAIKELGLNPGIIRGEAVRLKSLAARISREGRLSPRNLDEMMSFGERMSARIVSGYLTSIGSDSRACDAFDIGLVTDSNFGNADALPESYSRIRKHLAASSTIPVVTGFIGKDSKGAITTMGRGGSDYTACIIGSAIHADEIQIWTNVDGIMTADPRIVKNARSIASLSYEEESELEFLGASTLHPKGIEPAIDGRIRVRILNTLNPKHKGTMISERGTGRSRIASITHKEGMCIIKVDKPRRMSRRELMGRITKEIREGDIRMDTLSSSKSGAVLSISMPANRKIAETLERLRRIGKTRISKEKAKVSVVGESISAIPGISASILSSLGNMRVEAVSCGSSDTSQSFMVDMKDAERAIRLVHKRLFEE